MVEDKDTKIEELNSEILDLNSQILGLESLIDAKFTENGQNGGQVNKNLLKENIHLQNSLKNHLTQFESVQ